MPHLILEHSRDLRPSDALQGLMQEVFDTTLASGVFGAGKDIKTRTIACDHVIMGAAPATFAHLTLHLIAGRSVEVRAKLADDLLQVLEKHLPDVGSLSVLPIEIDPKVYRKCVL